MRIKSEILTFYILIIPCIHMLTGVCLSIKCRFLHRSWVVCVQVSGHHTCDEFESEMREIFLSFQGDF